MRRLPRRPLLSRRPLSTIKYSCPCNSVEVELRGRPVASVVCHCEACRRLTGGAVWEGLPFVASNVLVTRGDVRDVPRRDGLAFVSKLCTECDHRVFHVNKAGRAVVSLQEVRRAGRVPHGFEPQCHIYYEKRVLSIDDELPKYAVLPEWLGGDGRLAEVDDVGLQRK